MSALRLAGAALLVVCGWCAGDAARLRTQRHLDELEATVRLLRRLRREIGGRQTDLRRLYAALLCEGELDFAGASGEAGSFQNLAPPPSFSPREAECFRECVSALGRAEAVQECARLDYAIERFEAFRQQAQEESRTRLALARRLGIGAGLTAAVFFL